MSDTRARVLLMVDWFLPGERSGGPVRTVQALLHHLHNDIDFLVVTRDRDMGERTPYVDVDTGRFTPALGARIRYLTPSELGFRGVAKLLRGTPHDVLYLNTLFSWPFAIFPLAARRLRLYRPSRVVIAPRGQLNPGALGLKTTKKRAFLATAKRLRFYRGVTWQASNAIEQTQIQSWFGPEVDVELAANLRLPVRVTVDERSASERCKIVFLGRISPMKNLGGAADIVCGLRREVDFDIYGPVEDEAYWQRCKRRLDRAPENVRIRYLGPVAHSAVHDTLVQYDALLLPTLGENHGHVIAEALAVGCRPVISDRTPWRELADHGVGWDLPLDDPDAFRNAIHSVADESPARRAERAHAAARWIEQAFGEHVRIEAHLALFNRTMSRHANN